MNNNNLILWVLMSGILLSGIISGWAIRDCGAEKNFSYSCSPVVRIHDTLKMPLVEYRIIPGYVCDVDSIIEMVNNFWKDSLRELYGRGLFEARFVKEDNAGKREITLESRIPIDPAAELRLDEELKLPEVYPKRRFGIAGCFSYERNELAGKAGVRYYLLDYRNFEVAVTVLGKYLFGTGVWRPGLEVAAEIHR